MSRLEERYRAVLRVLPGPYRLAWEDDMVAAFLESVHTDDPDAADYLADHGRPSLGEVASVVSLAVRLRLGGPDATPRRFAWGQAVRLATLAVLLAHAVGATAGIAAGIWLSNRIGWLPAPPGEEGLATSRLLHTMAAVTGYAWLAGYLALVLGHRRVAQGLVLLAVALPAVLTGVDQVSGGSPLTAAPWVMLAFDLLLVIAMGAFGAAGPPVRRRPWLLAVPVGVLLVPVPLFAAQVSGAGLRFLDWPGLFCALVTAAMAGYLARRALSRAAGTAAWPLALSLLAGAAGTLRVLTLPDYRSQVDGSLLTATGVAQLLAVLAVGIPVGMLARRALRRLPVDDAHADDAHADDARPDGRGVRSR